MSKSHGIFTENSAIFCSNAGKTGNVPEFEFDNSGRPFLGDDIKSKIYIVTTSALDFKHLYTFYEYYPMKRIYLSKRISYLAHAFNCSSQK